MSECQVIDGNTGKCEDGSPAAICRAALAARLAQLPLVEISAASCSDFYPQFKSRLPAGAEYFAAKQALYKSPRGLAGWVKSPPGAFTIKEALHVSHRAQLSRHVCAI